MAARAQEAALKPRHRVLIVDDEESTRVLLARLLSKELDVEAQLAGTCEQALKLADDAYVMANGRIAKSGTGTDLLTDPAVQSAYLGASAARVRPVET